MKVLQINSVCGIRSTGRICTDLAELLTENGIECKVAYGRETVPQKYQKYAIRIGNDFDVYMHAAISRLFDFSGFGSKHATENFISWIETYDPDVIHLHNLHGYYVNIEVLFNYLKRAKKPIVWTLHDCWAFTGHCSYFTVVKCEKWKIGCHDCPQKKRYPATYLFDRSRENWNKKRELFTSIENMTIVTPSNWLAGLVKESFLKEYPVRVINNGIDTNIFKPTPSDFRKRYSLENKKIILGVASVWDERKGLNDFKELSKLLDMNYKIVIVGLTKKQIKKMPDSIICIERTNSEKELAEIYSAADVFINPTYEDNYPTTNLEAQACGTPVITYDTGGSAESIIAKESVIVTGKVHSLYKGLIFSEKCLFSVPDSIGKENYFLYLDLFRHMICVPPPTKK